MVTPGDNEDGELKIYISQFSEICFNWASKIVLCAPSWWVHGHNYMDHSVYGLSQWEMKLHCNVIFHWLSPYTECVWAQHHSGYGLSQWETTLQCNVVSHWLSPYTWCLLVFVSLPPDGGSPMTKMRSHIYSWSSLLVQIHFFNLNSKKIQIVFLLLS